MRRILPLVISGLLCGAPLAHAELTTKGDVEDGTRREALEPREPVARPAALSWLCVAYGVTQALDVQSTMRAIGNGAREANPLVGTTTGSLATMMALKAGGTAAVFLVAKRLWKKNRVAAIVTMVALDSASAAVVAHNYTVGGGR